MMFISTSQISTNQAQTNYTSFVQLRRTGVESDVTTPDKHFDEIYGRKIDLVFVLMPQIGFKI